MWGTLGKWIGGAALQQAWPRLKSGASAFWTGVKASPTPRPVPVVETPAVVIVEIPPPDMVIVPPPAPGTAELVPVEPAPRKRRSPRKRSA